jgi:hypothetical protein
MKGVKPLSAIVPHGMSSLTTGGHAMPASHRQAADRRVDIAS